MFEACHGFPFIKVKNAVTLRILQMIAHHRMHDQKKAFSIEKKICKDLAQSTPIKYFNRYQPQFLHTV